MNKNIILFDGVCNLCNGIVKFTIVKDKKKRIYFSSLQSQSGKELVDKYHLANDYMKTFIYLRNGKAYTKSSAALYLFKDIGGPWNLVYSFIIVPKFIRDFVYSVISKYRYFIFGKSEVCMVPTKETKNRFI